MNDISPEHPRAESLRYRERIVEGLEKGLVNPAGLSAHGRGEAFDYILGEETTDQARNAIEAGVAHMLLAETPVFSVNGNVAALVPEEIAKLEDAMDLKVEVNLFHESEERERKIAEHLTEHGVSKVYGTEKEYSSEISGIKSNRRIVDERGIKNADVVMVPLEDGDRTEELVDRGKTVITIDLNPLSRTAEAANVTIVDNIVRALPLFTEKVRELREAPEKKLGEIVEGFDNSTNLSNSLEGMKNRLGRLSEKDYTR